MIRPLKSQVQYLQERAEEVKLHISTITHNDVVPSIHLLPSSQIIYRGPRPVTELGIALSNHFTTWIIDVIEGYAGFTIKETSVETERNLSEIFSLCASENPIIINNSSGPLLRLPTQIDEPCYLFACQGNFSIIGTSVLALVNTEDVRALLKRLGICRRFYASLENVTFFHANVHRRDRAIIYSHPNWVDLKDRDKEFRSVWDYGHPRDGRLRTLYHTGDTSVLEDGDLTEFDAREARILGYVEEAVYETALRIERPLFVSFS